MVLFPVVAVISLLGLIPALVAGAIHVAKVKPIQAELETHLKEYPDISAESLIKGYERQKGFHESLKSQSDPVEPTKAINSTLYEELQRILKSSNLIELGSQLKAQIYPNITNLLKAIQSNADLPALKEIAAQELELNSKIKEENPNRNHEALNNRLSMFHGNRKSKLA